MSAKLHINLRQGVIEADGEPEFVEKVYKDFKAEVLKRLALRDDNAEDAEDESGAETTEDSGNGTKRPVKRAGTKKKKGGGRGPSCASRVLELTIPKAGLTLGEMKKKLEEAGHIYGSNQIGATLDGLYKRNKLRRTKKDGKWVYLNP